MKDILGSRTELRNNRPQSGLNRQRGVLYMRTVYKTPVLYCNAVDVVLNMDVVGIGEMDAFVTTLAKVDSWGVKRGRGQVRETAPTVLPYYLYVLFYQ